MTKIKTGKLVPICCDAVFKRMWGDPDNIDRLASLLSIIFHIPYKKLKDNIEIIESEKRETVHNEKLNRCDVVAKVKICSLGKVNLEMNLGFSQSDIDRNVSFLTYLFSNQLRSGDNYSLLEPVIQINFNDYDVDKNNTDIIDLYYFKNNHNHILTNKLQIYEINIAKCYDIWYDGHIEEYDALDREIIRICALMRIDNEEDFERCLREISMEENVKKDIDDMERQLSAANEVIMSYYGSEAERKKLERWRIESAEIEGRKKGIEEGIKEGIEQGQKQKQIEIAKNLLEQGIKIDIIASATGLTIEAINELKI